MAKDRWAECPDPEKDQILLNMEKIMDCVGVVTVETAKRILNDIGRAIWEIIGDDKDE